MFRRNPLVALALVIGSALVGATGAADAKDSYPAVPLVSTGTNVLGETIHYPPGAAHVTASIVTLAPGARTIVHKHGVPFQLIRVRK